LSNPGDFWTTPGAVRFLNDFTAIVKVGRSAIVQTPELHPNGMVREFKEIAEKQYDWIELTIHDNSILEAFSCVFPSYFNGKAASLPLFRVVLRQISEKCFFLDCRQASPLLWEEAKGFLMSFQVIMKDVEPLKRSILVIMAPHFAFLDNLRTDSTYESLAWSNYVRLADIKFMIDFLGVQGVEHSIANSLRREVIASLCLWDSKLMRVLLCLNLESLLSPERILQVYAEEMSWDKDSNPSTDELRISGIVQKVEDMNEVHTAYACSKNDQGVLYKRIWIAQVRILFPYIEFQRELLITKYGYAIRLSYANRETGEMINNLEQLEIGSLAHLFRRSKSGVLPRRVVEFTCWLKDVRNYLAHRKYVQFEFLKQFLDKEPVTD